MMRGLVLMLAGATTLAAREKEAIVKTLDAHGWKLATAIPGRS